MNLEIRCQSCGHAFDSPLSGVGKIEYTQCENIFRMDYGVKIPCPNCKEILKVVPDQSTFVGVPLKKFSRTNQETKLDSHASQKQDILLRPKTYQEADPTVVRAYPQKKSFALPKAFVLPKVFALPKPFALPKHWYRTEKAQKYSLMASAFLFVICTVTIVIKEKQAPAPVAQNETTQSETLNAYYENELNTDIEINKDPESMQGGLLDNHAKNSQIEEKMLDSIKRTKADLHVLLLPPLRKVTSSYGVRLDPFTKKLAFHGGLDFQSKEGSNVFAALDGTVEFAGRRGGYGNAVIIKHAKGYKTLYGHLQKPLVKKGQKVGRRDIIGLSGSTGRSTGPHLHFELHKNDKRIDPLQADLIPKN